jgi:hypothetical protein
MISQMKIEVTPSAPFKDSHASDLYTLDLWSAPFPGSLTRNRIPIRGDESIARARSFDVTIFTRHPPLASIIFAAKLSKAKATHIFIDHLAQNLYMDIEKFHSFYVAGYRFADRFVLISTIQMCRHSGRTIGLLIFRTLPSASQEVAGVRPRPAAAPGRPSRRVPSGLRGSSP